ncbi:RING finger protein PSH1 [Wickerhamiella sorbophila]|uniref:RING finger protein PSH1 n=1 Tax=Wickerhamiella sorbophila TaxID=45607 RepID=A0A2T0FML4_9ASCO|nr:RING finger protein PSH1 [Wickerhamiella sorbophila]PRT56238.1 RING finger protein PSH1 [Wickerhamiella sorbophila]
MENLARVAGVENRALEAYLKAVSGSLTCHVCHDIMCEPYMLQCGHAFCGVCLEHWFRTVKSKSSALSCPVCRTSASTKPVLSLALRDIYNAMIQLLRSHDAAAAAEVEKEALTRVCGQPDPFGSVRFTRSIIDPIDGVERCAHCQWEMEDGICPNCASDDDFTDASMISSDDQDIDMDVEDENEYEADFIDDVYHGPYSSGRGEAEYVGADESEESGSESSEESDMSDEDELDRLERRAEQQRRPTVHRVVAIDDDDDDIEILGSRNVQRPELVRRVIEISDSE